MDPSHLSVSALSVLAGLRLHLFVAEEWAARNLDRRRQQLEMPFLNLPSFGQASR